MNQSNQNAMDSRVIRLLDSVIEPICRFEDTHVDYWRYFLAHGLAFGFLVGKSAIGPELNEQLRVALNAAPDPEVQFQDAEIFETAGRTFHGIRAMEDTNIATSDLLQAIIDNFMLNALNYKRLGTRAMNVSWTAFDVGLRWSWLAIDDGIRIHIHDQAGNIAVYTCGESEWNSRQTDSIRMGPKVRPWDDYVLCRCKEITSR